MGAQAEGAGDRVGFLRLWEQAHGAGKLEGDAWVLHFELVEMLPALADWQARSTGED